MWAQMLKFGLVGGLATFVHMVIGALLIQSGWAPLTANTGAFAVAFLVSFVGHLGFSFSDQDTDARQALRRFACVALLGFGVNEALLSVLLAQAGLGETLCLWLSTGSAALVTFVLSKLWAFRAPQRTD